MNRSNIYLTDKQVRELRRISRETGAPMAEIIRRAVDAYIAERQSSKKYDRKSC